MGGGATLDLTFEKKASITVHLTSIFPLQCLFYILYNLHCRSLHVPDSCHSDWMPGWPYIDDWYYCVSDEQNGDYQCQ